MGKFFFPILASGLLFLQIASCKKDFDEKLEGKWSWVESVGGIGGWTLTPKSEDLTRRLEIDGETFTELENGLVVFSEKYELETKPDSAWGTNRYLKFEGGLERAVKISGSELLIYDLGFDGFVYKYERQ